MQIQNETNQNVGSEKATVEQKKTDDKTVFSKNIHIYSQRFLH